MWNYPTNYILTGDMQTTHKWLPFARTKLESFRKNISNGAVLQYVIKNDNEASIRIVTNGKQLNKIFIDGKQVVITCPNYLSGIVTDCVIQANGTLYQYYPSAQYTTRAWRDEPSLAVPLSTYYGTTDPTISQHAYLKSTMFSGDLRYMVQEMLGMNKAIELDYKANKCHGFLYRNYVIPKYVNGYITEVNESATYALFHLDETGLYWKSVSCCKRDLDKNITYPDVGNELQVIAPPVVPKFTSFSNDIVADLASGRITQLLTAEQLAPFFTKQVLYPEQGWLFSYSNLIKRTYNVYISETEYETKQYFESVNDKFYISNTCIDKTNGKSEHWKIEVQLFYDVAARTLYPQSASLIIDSYNLYFPFQNTVVHVPDYVNGFSYSPNIKTTVIPTTNFVAPIYTVEANTTIRTSPISEQSSLMVIPPVEKTFIAGGNIVMEPIITWPPFGDSYFNTMIDKPDGYQPQTTTGNSFLGQSYITGFGADRIVDNNGNYIYSVELTETYAVIPTHDREVYLTVSKTYAADASYDYEQNKYIVIKRSIDGNTSCKYYSRYGKAPNTDMLKTSILSNIPTYNPQGTGNFSIFVINDAFDKIYYSSGLSYKCFNYIDICGTVFINNMQDYPITDAVSNLCFVGRPNPN